MSYGCYDREPFKGVVEYHQLVGVPLAGEARHTGVGVAGVKVLAWPNRFQQECQYTLTSLGNADPGCAGCKWSKQ